MLGCGVRWGAVAYAGSNSEGVVSSVYRVSSRVHLSIMCRHYDCGV